MPRRIFLGGGGGVVNSADSGRSRSRRRYREMPYADAGVDADPVTQWEHCATSWPFSNESSMRVSLGLARVYQIDKRIYRYAGIGIYMCVYRFITKL